MSTNDYFLRIGRESEMLREHGFDGWPDVEGAVRYAMETNDRLDAVCEAFGLETSKDCRGRWYVHRANGREVL